VPEASNSDDAVRDRLRAVLAGTAWAATAPAPTVPADAVPPAADPPSTARAATAATRTGRAGPDRAGPDRAGPDRAGPDRAGPDRVGPQPAGQGPDRGGPAWSELIDSGRTRSVAAGSEVIPLVRPQPGPDPHDGGGPTRTPGLLTGVGAFDPGRRGVKALSAVAAVVVLIAAVLAWRARPHLDPIPTVPGPAAAAADLPGPAGASTGPAGEVVVAVAGKVRKPGLVRLPAGARVADALQAAGGAEAGTDPSLLNLARKVVDGELILVGVTPPPGSAVPAGVAGAPAAGTPAGGPINLNTATLAELDTLPGVGPVLAQRILDHRTQHGGFKAVSDLRKVDGIGSSRYEQLKDLVTV
jgi:competence protein ComEA